MTKLNKETDEKLFINKRIAKTRERYLIKLFCKIPMHGMEKDTLILKAKELFRKIEFKYDKRDKNTIFLTEFG